MEASIKQIEDLSLNAWPSHKMQLYDGWILRFSYFYTHRTNSVEQFAESVLPWSEKIPYCESEYQRMGSPAVFKISPLVTPNFDFMLENRGYRIEHVTDVMTLSLHEDGFNRNAGITPAEDEACLRQISGSGDVKTQRGRENETNTVAAPALHITQTIPSEWIEGLFSLKKMTDPVHRRVVPSMYQAIPKETICVWFEDRGEMIATGLGILDRDFIGIYAIHVREDYRRRGLAREICLCLLTEGQKKGAGNAYLQVVEGNAPARRLYEGLGFRHLYRYWFRVQPSRP